MSSYSDTINYLYNLQKHGIKLGLEKTEMILSYIEDPHSKFLSIHVSGTNGKGSTSAMIASILMAQGFKVGLYTSPHLVSFTERIRINNEQISEFEVVKLTEEIKFKLQNSEFKIADPTFFEFVTVMAFLYFFRNGVDWAVIEAGMGGRLDATNVITPEVSVITKISYDHEEFLGKTLTDITKQEAGIIKKGIPTISAHQGKEAENVINAISKEKSSPLFIYGKDFKGIVKSSGIKGITFDYSDDTHTLTSLHTPLPGEHQLFNACMAIKAVTVTPQPSKLQALNAKFIKDGLASTKWPGRLELIADNPPIMIDAAHNPDAANVLSEFIKGHLSNYNIFLIIGVMSDKDIAGILTPLLPLASEIIFTAPNYGRAAHPQRLANYASEMGFSARVTNSVKESIEMAIKGSNELLVTSDKLKDENSLLVTRHSSLILITGSFYTIGEAMEVLGKDAILGRLRETV